MSLGIAVRTLTKKLRLYGSNNNLYIIIYPETRSFRVRDLGLTTKASWATANDDFITLSAEQTAEVDYLISILKEDKEYNLPST